MISWLNHLPLHLAPGTTKLAPAAPGEMLKTTGEFSPLKKTDEHFFLKVVSFHHRFYDASTMILLMLNSCFDDG